MHYINIALFQCVHFTIFTNYTRFTCLLVYQVGV